MFDIELSQPNANPKVHGHWWHPGWQHEVACSFKRSDGDFSLSLRSAFDDASNTL
jgi:hypothetical protein